MPPNEALRCRFGSFATEEVVAMKTGLLWYDGDRKKDALDKMDEGARCYEERFGHRPNACHANPAAVIIHPKLRVVPNRLIQPNHFWLGVEEE